MVNGNKNLSHSLPSTCIGICAINIAKSIIQQTKNWICTPSDSAKLKRNILGSKHNDFPSHIDLQCLHYGVGAYKTQSVQTRTCIIETETKELDPTMSLDELDQLERLRDACQCGTGFFFQFVGNGAGSLSIGKIEQCVKILSVKGNNSAKIWIISHMHF